MNDARGTPTEGKLTAIDLALQQGKMENEIKWIRAL